MSQLRMARGKKSRSKLLKRCKEDEEKAKPEPVRNEEPKRTDEKSNKISTYFKSEEMQEICTLLNTEELGDQHCFFGAVVIGKFDVVKRLLKDGYPVDFMDESRETALMLAVKHFRLEMVDFLVSRCADISLVDSEGNNILLLAANNPSWDQDSFSGFWHSVRDNPKLRPNHGNKAGYTLLHYVTKRQWHGMLEQLLSTRILLDCVTNKGVTPLILAASRGDISAVKALMEAGADITVEDQQKCTALCYAIAFRSLQKNTNNQSDQTKTIEFILAAVNDESSKITLELYLQRRLDMLVNPPKTRAEFAKIITSVLVHVVIFFARFIYSGMDLLMDLHIFHRLREAVERHSDDPAYLAAVMLVVLELCRHCDCCCLGLNQTELADAFFSSGLGKCFLDILARYGMGKTAMIKAVFQPLLFLCTSDSYKARTWLESNFKNVQPFYNKYMRSFPILFQDTNGDTHAEIEKQRSLSFQKIMKTLKSGEHIVTEEERAKAAQRIKEETLIHSAYSVVKPNTSTPSPLKIQTEKKPNIGEKRKKTNQPAVYNSIIQYNFGQLDIVQKKTAAQPVPVQEQQGSLGMNSEKSEDSSEALEQKPRKGKKSRIAIKEIQMIESPRSESSQLQNSPEMCQRKEDSSDCSNSKRNLQTSEEAPTKKKPLLPDIKQRFSEGYQLFQMEDDSITDVSEEENDTRNTCEWLDAYAERDGSKVVSNVEVSNTLKYLEEIFNRIVQRYDSTWKKQYMEGYLGAGGTTEDLAKLMTVLPALENYHMEKLIKKWNSFISQVQDHARKNHVVYAALVSEMQLFLLEFEGDLEKRNVKVFDNDDSSSLDSDLETEQVLRNKDSENLNVLSNGKPIEDLINKNSLNQTDLNPSQNEINNQDQPLGIPVDESNENQMKTENFVAEIYISDSEDETDVAISIWDGKVSEDLKMKVKSNMKMVVDTKEEEEKEIDDEADLEFTGNFSNIIENVESIIDDESMEPNSHSGDLMEEIKIEHSLEIIQKFTLKKGLTQSKKKIEDERMDTEDVPEDKKNVEKTPPPGFENVDPLNVCFEHLARLQEPTSIATRCSRVLMYSGPKYQSLCLSLVSLPACKTEIMDGGKLRLATFEFSQDFKLFNGCNFGDVELGLSGTGMPLAVRRFERHKTLCNKSMCTTLFKCVKPLLHLNHPNVLPYIGVYDLPLAIIITAPLCQQDLGQYVRQIRTALSEHPNSLATITPCLLVMARQLMGGLHYLHTQDKVIIHGNLKPSNVMVDASGALRLAEFGVHQVLFQQYSAALTTQIWWARECHMHYYNSWKFICTQQSDIQAAGMLLHFIVTVGMHPFGSNLAEIIENIKKGVILGRTPDEVATDLIYWMLSHEPDKRPTTFDVLRHVYFWDTNKRWDFLLTCCGEAPTSSRSEGYSLPIEKVYHDLDILGQLRDINTKWISALQHNCEQKIGSNMFEDIPSGLLKFLKKNLDNWTEVKDLFLEMFPILPLNLFRLLEQTVWVEHPALEPFTRVEPNSTPKQNHSLQLSLLQRQKKPL